MRRGYEKWLTEGWSPLRVANSGTAFVLTVVAIFAFATHPHHPGAWGWLALVGLALFLWSFPEMFRWRELYRRLGQAPVAPAHAEELKRIAGSLQTSIRDHRFANYGDGDRTESPHNKAMFESHFPDLAAPLQAWDDAIGFEIETDQAFDEKLFLQMELAGITFPQFDQDALRKSIRAMTQAVIVRGDKIPETFGWEV